MFTTPTTSWALAMPQPRKRHKNRKDRIDLFMALISGHFYVMLKREANFGREQVGIGLVAIGVVHGVKVKSGSVNEVPLDLGIEILIEVIAAGNGPILRVIGWQRGDFRLVFVVAVVGAYL